MSSEKTLMIAVYLVKEVYYLQILL